MTGKFIRTGIIRHPSTKERLVADVLMQIKAAKHSFVLAEGALIYCIEELRNLLTYKIFVSAKIETCLYRRIVRNIDLMHQTPEFIGAYYLKCARYREAEFCLPSAKHADVVIDNDVRYVEALDKVITDLQTFMCHGS